jgi:DNA-binding CsgD family transcriptional regulator
MQARPADLLGLTPLERRLLARLMAGDSNREIATHLGLHPRNVTKALTGILRKLKVRSRTEAAALALRRGMWL